MGQDTNECKDTVQTRPELNLYILAYSVRGDSQYKGVAVVRASTVREAERVLLSQSMNNGSQSKIRVNKIVIVNTDTSDPSLVAEEYYKVYYE